MALRKARKQIQLHGGMSDNVDDFVIQPPAVEYAENCHWRGKDGHLKKRMGSIQRSIPSFDNSIDDAPTIFHNVNDLLYTFQRGTVHRLDPSDTLGDSGAFRKTTVLENYMGGEKKVAMPPAEGLESSAYCQGPNGEHIVAYCERNTVEAKKTTVRIFEPDWTLRHEIPYGLFSNPFLTLAGDQVVLIGVIFTNLPFFDNRGTLSRHVINIENGTIGNGATLGTVNYQSPIRPGLPGSTVHATGLGGRVASVAYSDTVLAYESVTGDLHILASTNGFSTSSEHVYDGVDYAPGFPNPAGAYVRPLAVEQFVIPGTFIAKNVVLAEVRIGDDTSTQNRRYIVYEWNVGATQHNEVAAASSGAHVVAGALAHDGVDFHYALTLTESVDGRAALSRTIGGSSVGTYFGRYDAVSLSIEDETLIKGYRLTTNMEYSSEYGLVCGLQQYNKPHDNNGSAPQSQKPITSYLVRLSDTYVPSVLAVMDAGQSMHVDFTTSVQNHQLSPLFPVSETDFIVLNREMIRSSSFVGNFGASYVIRETSLGRGRINVFEFGPRAIDGPGLAFGDGLIIPSTTPLWFDGEDLGELTPLDSPEILYAGEDVSLTTSVTRLPSNPIANWRTFQAMVVYTDDSGNTHRSSPSILRYALDIAAPAGDNWQGGYSIPLEVTVPLSMFPEGKGRYSLEIYVSDSEDGTPKLAKTLPYEPNKASVRITVENTVGNDEQQNNSYSVVRDTPFIYTNGGVLAADPWPTMTMMTATSTRIWGIADEEPGRIFYSKLFEDFITPEWNGTLTVTLGDERQLTAIGKIDDKIVVFEGDTDIHVIYGPGPDNTGAAGADGGFDVHHVSSDVGCDDPNSVVEVPQGVVFRSRRGFYLLDRGLQLQFIGGGIEDLTRNTRVKTAQIVPEFAEVRFHLELTGEQVPESGPPATYPRPATPKYGNTLPEKGCVVWNYEFNRWTVFSDYDADATALWKGRYVRLVKEGSSWRTYLEAEETDDVWSDGILSGVYTMKIVTPPVPIGETIQGYSRLRKVTLLGRYLSSYEEKDFILGTAVSAGDIKLTFRYDYEATDADSKLWRSNAELQGGADRFQFQARPQKQKCQAVQLIIEEVPTTPYRPNDPAYALGRGFEISAVDLDLGLKDGPVRDLGQQRKQ